MERRNFLKRPLGGAVSVVIAPEVFAQAAVGVKLDVTSFASGGILEWLEIPPDQTPNADGHIEGFLIKRIEGKFLRLSRVLVEVD